MDPPPPHPPYTLDAFLWERGKVNGSVSVNVATLGKCHGSHSKDRKDKYNDIYMGNTKTKTDQEKNFGE